MSLSSILAAFAIETRGETIPSEAIEAGRCAAVDCIGCMIAGSSTPVAQSVRKTFRPSSQGKSTIVGTRAPAFPQDAALANGAAGHALDFDDVLWTMYGHPSVAILPTALAFGEDRALGGRAVLEAYVLGVEVASRIGRLVNPTHYEHGWHTTSTIGVFGATVAAARLMGMSVDATATAISIAASLSAGVRRNFGSMTKPFHAGSAARAGVLAAELAAAGVTADREALEGNAGWFRVLGGRTAPAAGELSAALGGSWDIVVPGIALKRYAACGCTHCALDAIVGLKQTHGFEGADIAEIECRTHPLAKKVLQHSRPTTGLEGKFSMEHSLAVAAVVGMPGLVHYDDQWVRHAQVRQLVPLVRFETDDTLATTPSADAVPAAVTVTLKDGRAFSARVDVPLGDPRRPMTLSDRWQKFQTCVGGRIDESVSRQMWSRLEDFSHEHDLSGLLAMAVPG